MNSLNICKTDDGRYVKVVDFISYDDRIRAICTDVETGKLSLEVVVLLEELTTTEIEAANIDYKYRRV